MSARNTFITSYLYGRKEVVDILKEIMEPYTDWIHVRTPSDGDDSPTLVYGVAKNIVEQGFYHDIFTECEKLIECDFFNLVFIGDDIKRCVSYLGWLEGEP